MRADEKLTAFLELESAIRDCSIGSKLSLQRGANFREGMGNGLRQKEDITMKAIENIVSDLSWTGVFESQDKETKP